MLQKDNIIWYMQNPKLKERFREILNWHKTILFNISLRDGKLKLVILKSKNTCSNMKITKNLEIVLITLKMITE